MWAAANGAGPPHTIDTSHTIVVLSFVNIRSGFLRTPDRSRSLGSFSAVQCLLSAYSFKFFGHEFEGTLVGHG